MRETQLAEMLTLSRWDQLDPSAQAEAAYAVASRLPQPFRFDGLETHELGQQRHRVAFFTWNEARFALIPGGPATLGYAPGSFFPNEAQLQSWEETRDNHPKIALEFPTIESYLEYALTPLRQVTLQPFLPEVEATGDIRRIYKDGQLTLKNKPIRVTHPQVQERIAQEGFRFPTSDEWEYACAAGARTLWRWGDDCPMIVVPRPHPKPIEWDLHLRPNAFGLLIGDKPSDVEFTAELGVLRGGDGGTRESVGAGRFVEWLALASAFEIKLRGPDPDRSYWYRIRRAYSIFQ
jgi:hypothetical protein